jgi:hypothetical protein
MGGEVADAVARFLLALDEHQWGLVEEGKLDESEVRDTVERVTGQRPRSFEQWASAHADTYR